VKRLEEKKQGDLEVFKWFRTHVIDSKLEPSIGHQELVSVSNINALLFLTYF
jgi:serine/threonine-protein kinase 19